MMESQPDLGGKIVQCHRLLSCTDDSTTCYYGKHLQKWNFQLFHFLKGL